jgi:imidazolonepropionase-like amidohydrolase
VFSKILSDCSSSRGGRGTPPHLCPQPSVKGRSAARERILSLGCARRYVPDLGAALQFVGLFVALLLPWGGPLVQAQQTSGVPATVIHAGRFFDSPTGKILERRDILIRGNRIEQVGEKLAVPAGANQIDLRNATVLPGFIDVHTHLTGDVGHSGYEGLGISVPRATLVGAKNARTTLLAGFTTVRNLGAPGYSDVALRDAINDGDVVGPRMQVSGPPLGISGGHCDSNLLPFSFHVYAEGVADGVPAVMAKVRETIKYGADVIKFCASGGVLSKGDNPLLEQYSPEEMEVLIKESHRLGRKVAAHAHSTLSINDAVRAGVDSIEHGIFIDDEGIALMKQHETYLVPTSYPLFWFEENLSKTKMAPWIVEKSAIIIPAAKKNVARAFRAGVKVALGTDAGVYPHGLNGGEFWSMVELGLTPVQSLQAGTVNAADLLGWTERIGSITPGKFADIVAVRGNPLEDVTLLQHVVFVMRDGVVYKNELPPAN